MEKPPFQFDLRAVFRWTTAAAVCLAAFQLETRERLLLVAAYAACLYIYERFFGKDGTPSRPPNSLAPADSERIT